MHGRLHAHNLLAVQPHCPISSPWLTLEQVGRQSDCQHWRLQARLLHQISSIGNGTALYVDRATLEASLSEVQAQNGRLQDTADNAMELLHLDQSRRSPQAEDDAVEAGARALEALLDYIPGAGGAFSISAILLLAYYEGFHKHCPDTCTHASCFSVEHQQVILLQLWVSRHKGTLCFICVP